MAGVKERVIQDLNVQSLQRALQYIENFDKELDAFKLRVLTDMRKLKSGEIKPEQLKVSDGDYEIMPEKPEIVRKKVVEQH